MILLVNSILNSKDYALDHFILGCGLIIAGLGIIIFHKAIKDRRDYWSSKNFPVGLGSMWTGKYTRGGLIFTYAMIIFAGIGLIVFGIVELIAALRS